nr:solute carrier family 12 member 10 [Equus caballus]
MLHMWSVILYLRQPWITAQAGIGMSPGLCWPVGRDSGHSLNKLKEPHSHAHRRAHMAHYPALGFSHYYHRHVYLSHLHQQQSQGW